MTIQIIPAGRTLADALAELYPNIKSSTSGIPSDSQNLTTGSSNPVATVSTSFKFKFDSGETISSGGLQDFVSDFVDAVSSGATLVDPFQSLSVQLPQLGVYPPWFLEYDDDFLLYNTDVGATQFSEVPVGDHYISVEILDAETGVDNFVVSQANNAWVGFRDGAFKGQFITGAGSYFPFLDGFDFIGNKFFSVSIRDGFAVISDGVTTKTLTNAGIGQLSNYTQIGGRGTGTSNITVGEVVLYDLDDETNSSVFSYDTGTVVDLVGTRTITQQPITQLKGQLDYSVDYSPFIADMSELKTKYTSEVFSPITSITSGNIGESFAFTGANWLMFYVEAYKKTLDTFWLDEAVTGVNHMFDYTDKARFDRAEITCAEIDGDEYIDAPKFYLNNDGVPANGWRRTFGGGWSLSVLISGVILSAITDVIDLIKTGNITNHIAAADTWLSKIPAIVDEHDTSWSETKNAVIDGSWYYVNTTNSNTDDSGLYSNPLAFNHSLKMLSAMAVYHKYLGNTEYTRKILVYLDFFKRHEFQVDNTAIWWYAYDVTLNTKTEDINHGSYDIHSFVKFNDIGLMTEADLVRYSECITTIPQYGRSGLLHYRLDGLYGGLPEDTISTAADNLSIALEWDYIKPYNSDLLEKQRRATSVLLSQSNQTTNYWAVYFAIMTVL